MKVLVGIFFSLIVALMLGCDSGNMVVNKPSNPQVEITVQPVFGAESLTHQTIVTTQEGYKVQFQTIKFYLTSVGNGSNYLTDAGLYDWSVGNVVLRANGRPENFTSLNGDLGVKSTWNHADPTAFDVTNPLYISIAEDMHWDWNPGYIFVKVEAKVDTLNDGVDLFDHNVVFHAGLDVNLQTITINDLSWVTINNNLARTALKIDMATFLVNGPQVIDLKTEYTTHSAPGQEAITAKVMENFAAAIQKL